MADSHKDIIITPNRNLSGQPQISFTGFGNDPITIKVLDDTTGALSFEGSAGQLFSITNNLTSGSIFSVNDVSGIPSIDVNADGTVALAPYNGFVGIGTTQPTEEVNLYKNQNQGTVFRIDNPNTGASANSSVRLATDVATLSSFAHASTRTTTRYGVAIGGYAELTAMSGNGLLIGTNTSSPVVFGTNNVERLRIDETDGVTVTGDLNVTGNLDVGALNISGIQQGDTSISITDTGTDGNIDFKTENTSRFFLSSTGNVGFGTTNPTTKLSIAGTNHTLNIDTIDREIVTPNYTVNPGWNLNTVIYSGKTPKSLTPETAPTDVFFKPDGTKMYVCGTTLDGVSEYDLSTPWDTTTAVHYQTFSTSLQETAPRGVTFTNDGLTMFIVGDRGFVIKYSLSIAWDVSTATFESQGIQSYYVYDRQRDSTGCFFKPDGTKMFICGYYSSQRVIVTYNLSTPWNINTAEFYDTTATSTYDTVAQDLYFKSDGTKMYIVGSTTDSVYEFNLSTPWEVDTLSLVNTLPVSGKNTVPSGIDFGSNGSYMYISDSTTDTITQYQLSTAWNISTASVINRLGAATDSVTTGVFFKSDGLKMYTIGYTGDAVYEYELSTAWDISTALYTDKLFVGYEDGTPESLFFKPDGDKLYFIGRSTDRVFEYTLPTAWSISSFRRSFYDLYRYTPLPRSVSFTADGRNMYSLSSSKNRVTQYALSTAWDINTLSYVTYVNVGSNDLTPEGLKFSSDGSKMYVIGSTTDSVYEYKLSTEWDISTATYYTSYSIAGYETAPTDIAFKYDGSVMYVIGTTGDDITEFNLDSSNLVIDGTLELNAGAEINGSLLVSEKITTYGNIDTNKLTASKLELSDNLRADGVIVNSSWNIEDATLDFKRDLDYPNFYIGGKAGSIQSLYMRSDGAKIYLIGSSSDSVHEYDLGTDYDISTATFVRSKSVSADVGGSPVGLKFSSDGTKMFVLASDVPWAGVYKFTLSTAWNISTATYTRSYTPTVQEKSISGEETNPQGIYIKSDGLQLFVVGQSGDDVTKYTLTTAWSLTTATAVSTFLVASEAITATSIAFSTDGLNMYISDSNSANLYRYALDEAWDITTASFDNGSRKEYTIAQSAANDEIFIGGNPDGKKLYVLGNTADTVYQYTLGTAWEIDTATYDSKSFPYGSYLTSATGISFKSDGTRLYLVGTTTDLIYEFDLSTAWDISTATYNPGIKEVTVSTESPAPHSFYIRSNGTDLFVLSDDGASSTVKKYSLSTAWDISTASYVSGQSVNVGVPETDVRGLSFSSDGTKMYVVGLSADYVEQYNLSTAWNLTTASYSQNFYVGNREASAQGVTFSTNGEYFFIVGSSGDNVYRYSMTTPWDISTAEFEYLFLLSGQDSTPVEVFFNEEGTKMYMAGAANNRIYQYSLAIPWDITSSLYLESTPDLRYHTATGGISGVFLNPTADKLFVSSSGNGKITQFTLDIDGFTSTLNLGKAFNIGYTTGSPYGLYFKSDGLLAYVVSGQYIYELTLGTAWSIVTAESTNFKDLSSTYNDQRSLFFSSDGTKFYHYEVDLYRIQQWNVGTAWNIESAYTLQNKWLHLQKYSTGNIGIFLSSDGTKIYFVAGNKIYQHTLDTAWDLSSVDIGDVLKLEDREASPQGITFGGATDGTRLYVTGSSGDDVTQYNLSTAWDISTAVYSTAGSVESLAPYGVSFSADGLKMYVADGNGDRILQYTLTTAWAVNTRQTASIVKYNLNVGGIMTGLTDIQIRTTGTNAGKEIFVIGSGTDTIKRITLPTAWDLNSIDDTNYLDLNQWPNSGTTYTLTDFAFDNTGTKFFLTAYAASNSRIYEYALLASWDLSSLGDAPSSTTSLNVYSYERYIQDISFNADGTKIYGIGSYNDRVFKYDLPTAYSLSGATNFDYMYATREDTGPTSITYGDGNLYIAGTTSDRIFQLDMNGTDELYGIDRGTGCIHIQRYQYLPQGIFIRPDGLKMYIIGADDQVNQYALSTAWDIQTATYEGQFSVSGQEIAPTGVSFKYDGTKMYMCGSSGDDINEYDLLTPWDITDAMTTIYVQTFSIASFEQAPTSIYFRKDGEAVFISGSASGQVHHFSLSTPWDISTMSYVRSVYIGNQESALYSVYFKSDGLKMYCLGGSRDRVLEYRLTVPWDISTAILNKEKQVNAQTVESNSYGLFFDTLGTKMYVTGYINGELYQFDLLPRSKTLSIDGTTYINGNELVSGDLTVNGDTTVRGKLGLYDKVYTGSFTANRALKVNIDGTDMYLLLQTI